MAMPREISPNTFPRLVLRRRCHLVISQYVMMCHRLFSPVSLGHVFLSKCFRTPEPFHTPCWPILRHRNFIPAPRLFPSTPDAHLTCYSACLHPPPIYTLTLHFPLPGLKVLSNRRRQFLLTPVSKRYSAITAPRASTTSLYAR